MDEKKESLFRNKSYLYLIAGQLISNFGTWLNILGVTTLVAIQWNASPVEVSLVPLSLMLPMILFGTIAGVFVDRIDRKKVMILSDLFSGVAVLGLVLAEASWHVYLILFIQGTLSAMFTPAKNGKLKEIVPEEHMQQAMAVSSMINSTSKIAGPIISGVLVAAFGVKIVFYIDALTYFISALLLFGVPATVHLTKETSDEKESFMSQFLGGFKFLRTKSSLLIGMFSATVVFFVLQLADTQFGVLVRQLPEMEVEVLGFIMAGAGAGILVSSTILSKVKIQKFEHTIGLGTAIVGLEFVIIVFIIKYLPIHLILITGPLIIFIGAGAFAFVMIPFQTAAQKETPVEYSGRVFGTINSTFTLATLLGTLSGGILVALTNVNFVFVCSGTGLMLIGAVLFGYYQAKNKKHKMIKAADEGL
ncbi:MAG: MFS transporter [Bacillaceae bacterium]|nr:MFS transporter [Bacillaceae bacterium]